MSATPRPYLRAEERRLQLLGAAARCVQREGLGGISMSAVAREAGVSRQLLYNHFDGLPALVRALLFERFGALREQVAEAMVSRGQTGERPALTAARMLLSTSVADRHLYRTLLGLASMPSHPLAPLAVEVRADLLQRWGGLLGRPLDAATRGLLWALIGSTISLGDLVDAGELEVDQAVEVFRQLIDAVLAPLG